MLPSTTRTTVSVSLTVLLASGSVIDGLPPPMFTTRVLSVTSLTEGWTCRMMLPASSIWGVTSSTMPEKNGCTVMVGEVCEAPALVTVFVVMLVTKNSSVPTLSTAFWLLMAAMRGLESTCVWPCDSRKLSNAAKLPVCRASPKTAPAGFAAAKAPVLVAMLRLVGSARRPRPPGPVPSTWGVTPSRVAVAELVESWPSATRLLKRAQLIPA